MNLKQFFRWLTSQPGYKSRSKYSDAEYFSLSGKASVLPLPDVSNAQRFWNKSGTLSARCRAPRGWTVAIERLSSSLFLRRYCQTACCWDAIAIIVQIYKVSVCAHQPNDHVADTLENLINRGARQPCGSADVYQMTDPRYQDIPASAIPEITDDDETRVRGICGKFWGKGVYLRSLSR
jgi:hypothetical protein